MTFNSLTINLMSTTHKMTLTVINKTMRLTMNYQYDTDTDSDEIHLSDTCPDSPHLDHFKPLINSNPPSLIITPKMKIFTTKTKTVTTTMTVKL